LRQVHQLATRGHAIRQSGGDTRVGTVRKGTEGDGWDVPVAPRLDLKEVMF